MSDADPETEAELYGDLPEDPELAFLRLEKFFRDKCEKKINAAHQNEGVNYFYVEYMGRVLAAIKGLELTAAFDTELPRIQNVDYDTYMDFSKEVEHYQTGLQIRLARRSKSYSVRVDTATKAKIHHHIEQVRVIVEKLEVTERKKDALLERLNDFGAEVDRSRTRLESLGALIIEAAEVFGEAAEKAEPARKWIETIARLVWGARRAEDEAKQLPPPREKKQIEPPRKEPPAKVAPRKETPKAAKSDDEIPF